MQCDHVRESLSAMLDGEPSTLAPDVIDRHLGSCPGCRRWHDDVARINRRATLGPAGDADSAPPGLLDAVMAGYRVPTRARGRQLIRAGLLLVALAQLGIGLLGLLPATAPPGGGDRSHGALPGVDGHLGHEAAAFNLAIGAALLWIVARPRTARGPLPLLAAFVVILVGLSALDVLTGEVGWDRLASHLPVLAGVLLAGALSRLQSAPDPLPGLTRARDATVDDHATTGWHPVADPASDRDRQPPAARMPAA
ncbi:MAG: zf-HC2 domain-containing protein [Actinomycetota bacterium]|nr:zf-HC2 domain-containing protein [Actinomycetota bacterium]